MTQKDYATEKEGFWASDFSAEYIQRNQGGTQFLMKKF